MDSFSEPPLEPPPRRAHLRRGLRNLRRAYRLMFVLVIVVFGGWAALDALRWDELPAGSHYLTIGFALISLLALIVWRVVENPLGRELRLARQGIAAMGKVTSVGKPRGRRGIVKITYTFQTAAGAEIAGACKLPRRFPIHTLEPGTPLSILYDPRKPRIHKPRLALDFVVFGDPAKKKTSDG